MKVSMNIKNKLTMLSEMENDSTFQILEYDELEGARNINTSKILYYVNRSGMILKQPRIILDDSAIRLQPGALSYMKGNIEINNVERGIVARGRKFISNKIGEDKLEKPIFRGNGEIFLEPSFGYFTLIELEDDEIIINDSMFYACEEGIQITTSMKKTVSSMLYDKNEIMEITLYGSGIVLLELPVPEKEVFRCKIYEDVLKLDGEFAILRSGNISFSVEKSGSNKIGATIGDEGLLNVYSGTGEVWLIPTNEIYNQLNIEYENIIEEEFI